jgi:hypothetical protein
MVLSTNAGDASNPSSSVFFREQLESRPVTDHERRALPARDVHAAVGAGRRRKDLWQLNEALDLIMRRARRGVERGQQAVVALQKIQILRSRCSDDAVV